MGLLYSNGYLAFAAKHRLKMDESPLLGFCTSSMLSEINFTELTSKRRSGLLGDDLDFIGLLVTQGLTVTGVVLGVESLR